MRKDPAPYDAVIPWDLGHRTPSFDGAFVLALCRRLGEGIKPVNEDYANHLLSLGEEDYPELREVIEVLADERIRVLMLWDGFDKPLATGRLTRNLWDQLRELASYPSLRLVTATRRNLQELIRSEESVSSDFWNIFDMTPVKLGVFDDADREAVYAATGLSFFEAARTELDNWTGGYPPLFLAVVNEVVEMRPVSGADNEIINQAASHALDKLGEVLNELWDDCPQPAKDLYCHLCERGELGLDGVGKTERTCLAEKGFVKFTRSTLSAGCRLLKCHLRNMGSDTGSLARLFGCAASFRSNIRGLLELWLAYPADIDPRLHRLIQRAIEDIPNYPNECLSNLRSIADRVLDLIWDAEFGPSRAIPSDHIDYWEYTLPQRRDGRPHNLRHQFAGDRVPTSRGLQVHLLQLLTGAAERIERRSRYVSRNTYVLLNSLQTFGDFGQHLDNTSVPEGTAIAAIVSCLELAASLETDLALQKVQEGGGAG